jgi:hypothetical protein
MHHLFLSRFLRIKGLKLGDIYMFIAHGIVSGVNMYVNTSLMLEKD